ncbi:hypothetical protein Cgig2_033219 [Carnegiea gigantea]|uniref:Aminotransferase-like plant mobile domain-containing protein n=1 Tax=Carnegiea gigantea TaxID=171969 RepID=A0A9Q1QC55_9CARY|nr:hypothetical protein Cgig2_033219 [Carnegiea gigantea]
MLSPKPTSLMVGEPRLARWHNVNKSQSGFLMEEIESARDIFLWRPYALHLKNWKFPKFYSDNERWVWINSEVGDEILSFARCLRACELIGMDCVEQYLPQRVGMQFGMDQDIPNSFPKSDCNLNRAWMSYDTPLDGWKLYLPPREVNGEVTIQYLNWWKAAIFARHNDPMTHEKLSHVVDGNMGVGGQKASPSLPPSSPSPFHRASKLQMGESSSCTKGSPLMGGKEDIGKDTHTMLGEDHRELQERRLWLANPT